MVTSLMIAGLLAAAGSDRVQVAQLILRQRVVVRVQSQSVPAPRIDWTEHKGPRCIPMSSIVGAAVTQPGSVDIVERGGQRVRARFAASCPALDYYSGFYVAPTGDGRICADRDTVRDRAGGECEITRFRVLKPRR